MTFVYPHLLLLLIPVGVLCLLSFFKVRQQRRTLHRFGDKQLVQELMPDLSLRRKLAKHVMLSLVLVLMVLAAARPQVGQDREMVELEGIEMMVCLDLSNSMLAQDVAPSRLAQARGVVSGMMERMTENKVGLIFFAGSAYIQLPVTADLVSARMFLDTAHPSLIADQGTDIAKAIDMALASFDYQSRAKKAIVLITDAEDNEEGALEAMKRVADREVLVSVIGVGTPGGAPVPNPDGGYITDEAGQTVTSRLDESVAKQIAAAGKGVYIHADGVAQAVRAIRSSLAEMEKTRMQTTRYASYREVYHYFLLPALLLLLLYFVLLDRKNRWVRRLRLFDR